MRRPDPAGITRDVSRSTDDRFGIYLHVPFCARRCGYCAFVTYAPGDTSADQRHERWADAAIAEVAVADRELGDDRPAVTSVYIGGGTPGEVEGALLEAVLGAIRHRFEMTDDVEINVELNPDGIRAGQLGHLAEMGVTRASFGMQSAVPHVLETLDRTHVTDNVALAVEAARSAGMTSVSLDLIHGTPGETADDFDRTLDVVVALAPDHVSAYALAIEPGTKLAARVRSGRLASPSGDEAADRYETLETRLTAAGYDWYELSNWAGDARHRCRHNLGYWRDADWWGIGPGAHSHVRGRRWWNHDDLDRWSSAALAGRVPAAGDERPTEEEQLTERIMLGIRLAEGIPCHWAATGSVAALREEGLVEVHPAAPPADADGSDDVGDVERVVLTFRGRLLADRVVARLRWG